MADSGKQSPLGVNALGSLLNNQGLCINPIFQSFIGTSTDNSNYTVGSLIASTPLNWLTYAINDAFVRSDLANGSELTVNNATYTNLIQIGSGTIPALGNSLSPGYTVVDPSGTWTTQAVNIATQAGVASPLPGPATAGFALNSDVDQGQYATWYPYDLTNVNKSITQWGFLRLFALQGYNEFNYNANITYSDLVNYSTGTIGSAELSELAGSILNADGFISSTNPTIMTMQNSSNFLDGTYSNMNDLITGDITGVSLSTQVFGSDLMNLGGAIDLSKLDKFGLPSVLLQTLYTYNAITEDLNVALLSANLEIPDIIGIENGEIEATVKQEQQIYSAFLLIQGENLKQVLIPLNCKTEGLETLADLLDVKKLFPQSFQTLTVPIYNTQVLPTNSKTYYLIYSQNNTNEALSSPAVVEQVGTQVFTTSTPVVTTNTVDVPSVTTTVDAVVQAFENEISTTTRPVVASITRINDVRDLQ